MSTSMPFLDSVPQTKYLSAENYIRYRTIMRLFYQEYEKMHYQLDRETIWRLLREHPAFAQESSDGLNPDLDQLVSWKNLTAIQDPHRVYTISDFKNRQYQYMMTQSALEIERMTITLENLSTRTTGLSSSAFRRLHGALAQVGGLEDMSLREVAVWWQDLQDDFARLSQNHQDYLREFYGPGEEKHRTAGDFISHKQHLIHYLEEFIRDLQSSSAQIGAQLEGISQEQVDRILELVCQSHREIPRAQLEEAPDWEERLRAKAAGIWQSMHYWFVGPESTAGQVMEVTNEVIRRVVQNAALLVQMQSMGVSNKAELRHFLTLFARCETVGEAHRLSSQIFGVQEARHFTGNAFRETERVDSGTYDETPMDYTLTPRTRKYKPRMDRSGFADKREEKQVQRAAILEEQKRLRQEIVSCIRDGVLSFDALQEPISPQARTVLLSWMAMANLSPDGQGRTEYGQRFTLRRKKGGTCSLLCTDGRLTMPDCTLFFEEEFHV